MVKFTIDEKEYFIPEVMTVENYSKIFKIKDLFTEEYFTAKLVSIVSGAPIELILEADYQQISYLAALILSQIPTDKPKFVDRFELDGVHYGFFPNWKDLTFAEFIDMDTISTKKPEELLDMLHILAAIMYRPIVNELSEHNFEIEEYDLVSLKSRSELFKKKLDVKYVLGAQFFFIKFATRYLSYTPQSLETKMNIWTQIRMIWMMWRMIYKTPSKSRSGGFWSSTKLLTTILLNMDTSTTKK